MEHTADWELQVWGPDMIYLLKTAAEGMYVLSGIDIADNPRCDRYFEIQHLDQETLVVDFLSELLFMAEYEGIAFDDFKLSICGETLEVRATGAPIHNQTKEIKAITYHGLQVHRTDRGLEVRIVFDV